MLIGQVLGETTDSESNDNARTTLSGLPRELLAIVIENLDVVSRACLALTSKPIARSTAFAGLGFQPDGSYHLEREDIQFSYRRLGHVQAARMWEELVLGRLIGGWLPASYRFCRYCCRARPTEWSQWTKQLRDQAGKDMVSWDDANRAVQCSRLTTSYWFVGFQCPSCLFDRYAKRANKFSK